VAIDGRIPLQIELDGKDVRSETVFVQAGAYALTIMTTIIRPDLPVELHSTYVGHPGAATHATHLQLGPAARRPEIETAVHDDTNVCVVFTPRNAVYDHAHELVALLRGLGHHAAVHTEDMAFRSLEASFALADE
jgi:hypothetical protein